MNIFFRLLTASFFIIMSANAQIEKRDLFPTPNASGLGTFGQIPVNLFTGIPEISVPIYAYKSRDLSIPISMSYHSGNIKPSERASWIGLGWSLHAGGLITRVLNDLPDEFIDYHYGGAGTQRGVFYKYNYLAGSTWNDPFTTLNSVDQMVYQNNPIGSIYTRPDVAPDEFKFDFMGMNGSLIMGQDGNWKLKSKEGLNFKVNLEIGRYALWEPTGLYPSIIRNCLTKFILTSADGTKYYFGADQCTYTGTPGGGIKYFTSNDSTAIEFNRMGMGLGSASDRDGGVIPTSWYLTKVVSSSGDQINLTYTRDGYQIIVNTSSYGTIYASTGSVIPQYSLQGSNKSDQVYILDGISLSSISGANGTIQFSKSTANILDYTIQSSILDPSLQFWENYLRPAYAYEAFNTGNTGPNFGPKSTFKKLDEIKVTDNSGARIKSFQFNYTENPNNRLFLNALTVLGSDGVAEPPYSFLYNNVNGLADVPYSTLKVDHWGYYNGIDPFTNLVFPNGYFGAIANDPYYLSTNYDATFNDTYTNNRSPVSDKMQYGLLSQINYPTGGNTQFVFEPHIYSKCINQTPVNNLPVISINDLGTSIMAGGVRIKQIISQANANSPALTKNYFYYRDLVNNNYASSGVLNSQQPLYVEDNTYTSVNAGVTVHYRSWSSDNKLPMHFADGSHVTYTNVVEANSDGSFNAYTYSNHDNGYLNKPPVSALFAQLANITFKQFASTSRQLERGLLLNEASYRQDKTLLHKKEYFYNDDLNRFDNAVRKIVYSQKLVLAGVALSIGSDGFLVASSGPTAVKLSSVLALNEYIHYPFLKKITESNYDQNGGNIDVTTKNLTYDSYRNLKSESVTTSKGEQLLNSYNYATDNILGLSAEALAAKNAMVIANMTSPVFEKTTARNSVLETWSRNNFKVHENEGTFLTPANREQAIQNNPLINEAQYLNYDSKGNILQLNTRNNISNSFQWDHNQAYPTVKIINADNTYRTYTTQVAGTNTNFLSWGASQFQGQTMSFTQAATGDIKITYGFSGYPGSAVINLSYTLQGPSTQSGTLCASINGSGCAPYTSQVILPNMPPGQYTLTAIPNSNYSIGKSVSCTYQTLASQNNVVGIKEFFYEGFEETVNSNIVTGNSNTGLKFFNGNYTVNFTPPNSKTYIIQWWNFANGKWNYNKQNYTPNTILTGPVDDVRVFPSDAQMYTYTYTPLIGKTSEIDPKGKTVYYEYDNMQRLKLIRDRDKNILKQFDYKYQEAPCAANWQNTATSIRCKQVNGQNTGEQEQEQQDVNTCSSTYNTFRWIVVGTNTNACPLPAPPVTIQGHNRFISTCQVRFTNTVTGIAYYFNLPPKTAYPVVLGQVPSGVYTVTFLVGSPVSATYNINGSTQTGLYGATFNNIQINSTATASRY
jgi:hypothetical protein